MSNPRPSIGRGRARGRIRQDGSSPGVSPVGSRATTVPVHDGLNTNVNEGTELKRNQRTKDRRPEVQRYVPRGRRDQDVPVNQAGQISQTEDHRNIENIPDTSKDRQHGSECMDEKMSQRKSKKSRIAQVYIPPSKRREIEQKRKDSHGDDESVSRSGENDNDVPENWDEDDATSSSSSFQDESGGQEHDACEKCENKQGSEVDHDDNDIKHSIQSDIEGSKTNHSSTSNDKIGTDKEFETNAAIHSSSVQYKCSDNDTEMKDDKVKKIRSKNGENILNENKANENDKDASSEAKEDMTMDMMDSVSQNDEITTGEQTSSTEMVELENKENSTAQNDTMEQIEHSCNNLDQKEIVKGVILANVSTSKTEDSCIKDDHNSVNDKTNDTEMMECSIPPCISDENKDGKKSEMNSGSSSKGQQFMEVEDKCSKNDERLKSEDNIIDSEQVAEVKNSAKSNSVFENLNEQDSTKASQVLDSHSTEQSQGNVEKSLVKCPDGEEQKSKDKKKEQTKSQSSEPNNDLKSSKESVKSQKSGKKKKLKDKIQEKEKDTVTGDMDIISIVSSDKMRGDENTKTEMESSGDKTKKKKKNVVKIKKKTKKQETDMEVIEQENEVEEEKVPESWTERNKIGSDNEEDSWDTMFDDDGECVDPSTMEELTANVGKVQIKKPVINYLNYQPKEPELDYEGMNHVIEIFDFSPDLKTEDLLSAFNQFKSKGFDIKWVDDTHALGVFSSEIAAKEALQFTHPLLKVQPLSLACKQSKIKAKKAVEFLQPYKPRPETTAVVARRMLTGALGLKTNVSKEQRDKEREEKQKLKQAKEKKKKDRQLKEDIWEGNVTPSVQSDE